MRRRRTLTTFGPECERPKRQHRAGVADLPLPGQPRSCGPAPDRKRRRQDCPWSPQGRRPGGLRVRVGRNRPPVPVLRPGNEQLPSQHEFGLANKVEDLGSPGGIAHLPYRGAGIQDGDHRSRSSRTSSSGSLRCAGAAKSGCALRPSRTERRRSTFPSETSNARASSTVTSWEIVRCSRLARSASLRWIDFGTSRTCRDGIDTNSQRKRPTCRLRPP